MNHIDGPELRYRTLVAVKDVSSARELARHLAGRYPSARVLVYDSNHSVWIQHDNKVSCDYIEGYARGYRDAKGWF